MRSILEGLSVGDIRTKPETKEYRDGWDRAFGKRTVYGARQVHPRAAMSEWREWRIPVPLSSGQMVAPYALTADSPEFPFTAIWVRQCTDAFKYDVRLGNNPGATIYTIDAELALQLGWRPIAGILSRMEARLD
jgi:hypothetical protein